MTDNFTTDDFLGGLVKLRQPKDGYRATSDAVLLAAAINPKKNQKVLDVGMGTGAVSLCLAVRCPEVIVVGMDIQPEMVAVASENVALNNMDHRVAVIEADIRSKHILDIPTGAFDWVITNPPFILEDQPSPVKVRDIAHREEGCSLAEWISNSLRYVTARGHFAMINRADRLPEILSLLYGKLGNITIIPIWTVEGESAKRVIVVGRKGVKSPAILDKGVFLMHCDGTRTAEAEAIMREGKPIFY